MWIYQYIFREESKFNAERLAQLRGLQKCAYALIDFISQFEDELVRVWQKPKFVRNVNYVLTLDKLTDTILQKVSAHSGAKEQVKEWRDLGLVKDDFGFPTEVPDKYKYLPLDTFHFKDLQDDILQCLGDLDSALDGEIVKSENWQALNTLRKKYKGRIKCIYIDPPFNLDSADQFEYRTNYKNANWATLLENRLVLSRDFLKDDGAIFLRCDNNGNWIVRCLLDMVFGRDNFRNEIIVKRGAPKAGLISQFDRIQSVAVAYDNLYWYSKSSTVRYPKLLRKASESQRKGKWAAFQKGKMYDRPTMRYPLLGCEIDDGQWKWKEERASRAVKNYQEYEKNDCMELDEYWRSTGGKLEFIKKNSRGRIEYWVSPKEKVLIDNNWLDIPGYANITGFPTENAEQPLKRIMDAIVGCNDIVLDFFAGSGTTQAVAQKLGRKWLGIEMGEHFYTAALPRLKKVIAGCPSGISKETKYKGGGAFKYYSLEQYEETLKNMHYKDGDLIDAAPSRSPFEQYVFLTDDKFSHVVSVGRGKGNQISIDLHKLYSDIDLPETLANLIGSPLLRRTADTAEYANGEKININLNKMTETEKVKLIERLRPALWWGE